MSQMLPTLEVDLSRIAQNYCILCQNAGDRVIAGVVKGNAYGLGIVPVATALYGVGCRFFFIANWQEALDLKLPGAQIYALSGVEVEEYPLALRAGVIPVLHRLDQVEDWLKIYGKTQPFAVQLNTTLNRLGLTREEFNSLNPDISCLKITQLSCGYLPDYPENDADLDLIKLIKNGKSEGSSCCFLLKNTTGMIRAGRWIYGIDSGDFKNHPIFEKLKPVATLTAPVVTVRTVSAGQHIGYNRGFYVKKPMRIAILNIGYSSGYIVLPGKPQTVWFKGKLYSVVSQSMDFTTIDIGSADCRPKDRMQLFGDNVPQENEFYKIRIAGDVRREYLNRLE